MSEREPVRLDAFCTDKAQTEITKMVVIRGGDGECDAHCPSPCFPLSLDLVPDQCRNVAPAKILDRANAGWRGDIDFGQIAIDHVNAHEQQATLTQRRSYALADLDLAL